MKRIHGRSAMCVSRPGFAAVLFLALACFSTGCASTKLVGTVSGTAYTSARGDYSVPFPSPPEIGGHVAGDDINGVTFTNNMPGYIVSFYSYPLGSEFVALLKSRGQREVLSTFVKVFYQVPEAPSFHPESFGGAISFAFLKDATERRRGVAAFIHGTQIHIVEMEPPNAIEILAGWDELPQGEIDAMLEEQALELLSSIELHENWKVNKQE